MSLFNAVMRSDLLSKGCKLYYTKLFNRNKKSKSNNWKIIAGKYENYNFIIARDIEISKKLNIGLTSIYKYKKTLKSLGLIDTLPKFTTRTNQCKNYHYRQLTVVVNTLPKKFISKTLVFCNSIKKARILKTSNAIISQVKKSLNNTVKNIHTKIKKMLNNVKNTNYINTNNSLNNLNKEDVQTVVNMLNTYKISFKKYEIKYYLDLYNKSEEKFTQTCKYCSDKKNIYAPLKYFTKVFESSHKPKNNFLNFKQREYDDTFFDSLIDQEVLL